jgi:glycosyltransferase involved in cell wall biosynthesis
MENRPFPKVSVIVPTYNRSASLPSAVGSIFSQTIPVHEVLVVDDGSTDRTTGVVEAMSGSNPEWKERLRYIRQDNLGKSTALNVGVQAATGEWIAFNDSDDRWVSEKLELQFKALSQYQEASACFGDVRYLNNPKFQGTAFRNSQLNYGTTFGIDHDVPSHHAAAWGIYMQTVVVRADVIRRLGGFDTAIRMSMDTDFVFRLGLTTPMCYVNLPLVEVDRTEERPLGLTTQYPRGSVERLEIHEYLQTKWLSLTEESRPDLRRSLLKSRSRTQSELANRHLLRNEIETARSVMSRAVSQNPRFRLVVKLLWVALAPGLLQKEITRREERSAR